MQIQAVSKSEFKPKALEYLREVEKKKKPLVVTHEGKPVVKIIPYKEETEDQILAKLRGSVIFYKDPTEPVGEDGWEVLE